MSTTQTTGILEIPVQLRTARRGTNNKERPQALAVLSAGAAVSMFEVPYRNFARKSGYQRPPQTVRVRKLASELRAGRVDLPTSVLFNLRDYTPSDDLIRGDGGSFLRLEPDRHVLYVVDGQHRILALASLVEEQPERWGDFEISCNIMLGATEQEELEEFYVVNSTAKSVRTDLAYDLLRQRAESDPNVMIGMVESGEQWKVAGQEIAELLAERPLWKGRIRFSGQAAAETTIGSSGMVGSLRPLLGTAYFGNISRQNQVDILDTYWQGIQAVLPGAFLEPTHHALQKSTGVQVMHQVLVAALEYVRSEGRSVVDPQSYEDTVREALEELQGDTAAGGIAAGVDFWAAGRDGAAGSYSSNAGRRVLTARIKNSLPEIRVQ